MVKNAMLPHPIHIENFVKNALIEDIPHGQDITSHLLIDGHHTNKAHINARQPGIIAGLVPALTAFSLTDPDFNFTVNIEDGQPVNNDETIATIEGPTRALLTAERTALNILSHLSGIATMTAIYVAETKGTNAKITCTRKTLPGLRAFQKHAVSMGGGYNHRHGLDDAIMIKDNHIFAAGSIKNALNAIQEGRSHTKIIEIEVDTLNQLQQVLDHGGAHIVLLDNMSPQNIEKAVKITQGSLILEASGGITMETVKHIAETGVDYISVGTLTHSAPSLDLGLDFEGHH